MVKLLGLIPARAGSKRVPGKNFKLLGGNPLIRWTLDAARQSGIFQGIVVSTDRVDILAGTGVSCEVISRPDVFARDDSPDIEWVRHALEQCPGYDAFAILRPTSPFRTAETIQRGWDRFRTSDAHSMRAVEPSRQHPGKMWTYDHVRERIYPVVREWTAYAPYHSSPTQTLVPAYMQNASLEMAWVKTVHKDGTIAGTDVIPFFTYDWEGFDINTPEDWAKAEAHVAEIHALAGVSPVPAID